MMTSKLIISPEELHRMHYMMFLQPENVDATLFKHKLI